jgi:hypothetical protein
MALKEATRLALEHSIGDPGAYTEIKGLLEGTFGGALTANGGLTLGDAKNIAVGTTTGTQIGTAAAQKLGFFGKAPVVQQAGAGQAEVEAITGGESPTEGEFNGLVTLVLALRLALVNLGLIKGSA